MSVPCHKSIRNLDRLKYKSVGKSRRRNHIRAGGAPAVCVVKRKLNQRLKCEKIKEESINEAIALDPGAGQRLRFSLGWPRGFPHLAEKAASRPTNSPAPQFLHACHRHWPRPAAAEGSGNLDARHKTKNTERDSRR